MNYIIVSTPAIMDVYIWRFSTFDEAETTAKELCVKYNCKIEIFELVREVRLEILVEDKR